MIGNAGVVVRRYQGPGEVPFPVTTSVSGTSVTASWSAATQTLLPGDVAQIRYEVLLYDNSGGSFVLVATADTASTSATINEPASPSGNSYIIGVVAYNTFASSNRETQTAAFSFVR